MRPEWLECWPSHETIAKDTGLSVSTVQRALRVLREQGYLETYTPAKRAPLRYRPLFPPSSQIGHGDRTEQLQIGHGDLSQIGHGDRQRSKTFKDLKTPREVVVSLREDPTTTFSSFKIEDPKTLEEIKTEEQERIEERPNGAFPQAFEDDFEPLFRRDPPHAEQREACYRAWCENRPGALRKRDEALRQTKGPPTPWLVKAFEYGGHRRPSAEEARLVGLRFHGEREGGSIVLAYGPFDRGALWYHNACSLGRPTLEDVAAAELERAGFSEVTFEGEGPWPGGEPRYPEGYDPRDPEGLRAIEDLIQPF